MRWKNTGCDISFGNPATYPNTSFKGTTIFQYKKGAGTANDEVLGFPVSYRNFNSISDLEFETTYNSDTFTSTIGLDTVATNVNTGFLIKNYSKTNKEYRNVLNMVRSKMEPPKNDIATP